MKRKETECMKENHGGKRRARGSSAFRAATRCAALAAALFIGCSQLDDLTGGSGIIDACIDEWYDSGERGFVTDSYTPKGRTYRTVNIGIRTWMAENLNSPLYWGSEYNYCYNNDEANCEMYGRLYHYTTAKNFCSALLGDDWRLPDDDDWEHLEDRAGDVNKLRSKWGWFSGENNSNGTDDYHFTALPGGWRLNGGNYDAELAGYWWSSSGKIFYMSAWGHPELRVYDMDVVFYEIAASVRCVKKLSWEQ